MLNQTIYQETNANTKPWLYLSSVAELCLSEIATFSVWGDSQRRMGFCRIRGECPDVKGNVQLVEISVMKDPT